MARPSDAGEPRESVDSKEGADTSADSRNEILDALRRELGPQVEPIPGPGEMPQPAEPELQVFAESGEPSPATEPVPPRPVSPEGFATSETTSSSTSRPDDETEEETVDGTAIDQPDLRKQPWLKEQGTKKTTKRSALRRFVRGVAELPILVALALGIAILIKTFLVQAFFIPSESMLPTLHVGDRVLVEKVSYLVKDPERGDVVVFAKEVFGAKEDLSVPWYEDGRIFLRELLGLPTGLEEDYIKRIVAVGGDTLRYEGSPRKLYVNGEVVPQDFVKGGTDKASPTLTDKDCERLDMDESGQGCLVPAGRVFVMGDNRNNSEDSRILGPIEEDKIVGHAFAVIWPPRDARRL